MEAEDSSTNPVPRSSHGLLLAAMPGLLISIGYIDPGKWAAFIDSGARFGGDLVAFTLAFNFVALLCHYLSARIGVVIGKNLAQISSEEYDKPTCILLGFQAELSMISLDLTMIIGIAHGLNMIFGADLFSCILITALNAVLYPLFSILLEHCRAILLLIYVAGATFLCYVLGMLASLPEFPASLNGQLSKLSGESAFTLMSLLGASVIPHNFYLHSSIVQRYRGAASAPNGTHDNLFATFTIFTGIFLVNYALVNSAATVFYSTGHGLLTFPDAIALTDHVFRSTTATVAFLILMFLANQITAFTWEFCGKGGQTILHDLFGMDLPGWLHCATIRIFSVVPALCCVWYSGAEGLYQMLIFTQITVALLLPCAVIPLFRIASSRPIMGVHKISPVLEFVALITFMGMLGLEITFVVEMIFGDSDWVSSLRWNMGNTASVPYVLLLVTTFFSLCFMLWLAATPLKSASAALDAQPWSWEEPQVVSDTVEPRYHGEEPLQKQENLAFSRDMCFSHSETAASNADVNLPDTIMDTDVGPYLSPIEESSMINVPSSLPSTTSEATDVETMASSASKYEPLDLVEKTVRIEGESLVEKDVEERETWELEDSSKVVPVTGTPAMSEGPGSFRSLSGEGGSGAGSLSRLSGLGRAARRQLAAILDEFWGQLYDFHGQFTQEAKFKKLDSLLGVETKPSQSLARVESMEGRLPDKLINTSLYDSSNNKLQSNLPYGIQSGSPSIWSNEMRLLDAYVQDSKRISLDSGERRYSSLRLPPSSDHGYQLASYLKGINKDRLDYINSQLASAPPKSSCPQDSLAFPLGQRPNDGFSSNFRNLAAPSPLQSEDSYYDLSSSGPTENPKKYHSLPDISGLTLPYRNLYPSGRSTQWGFSTSVDRVEQSSYLPVGSQSIAPLAFDELSPSRTYTNALSSRMGFGSDTGSLYARQPYEQFGVLDKGSSVGTEVAKNRTSSTTQATLSVADVESKLLQSLRHCILKLLKLEGSEWLFRSDDGVDEDLIDRVSTRERFVYEVETRDVKQTTQTGESQPGLFVKIDETGLARYQVSSVPQCGEGCVWKVDLILSFGVWCIHRILELSLMESRPELWGKYTYVLNRLQGIIDLAFFKPRTPMSPCFCLQVPASYQPKPTPPVSNGPLPPAARPARGKLTTSAMVLDMIKDVEIAISCRKGRSGTAAGDVAFPKGKENLASVLKRYKRRLSKPVTAHEGGGPGSHKGSSSSSYGS